MRRIIKIAGKAISFTITLFLFAIVIMNVYRMIAQNVMGVTQPQVFGWSSAVVISGSMADAINVNDLVVVHNQDSYETDDVIMFESGRNLVTHRIINITDEGFTTKGDANNTADANPVTEEQIVGKVVWVIPKVGVVIGWLQTPLGMLCLVLVGFLLIEGPVWIEQLRKK